MKKMIIDDRDPEVITKSIFLMMAPFNNLYKVTYFVVPLVTASSEPIWQITFILITFLIPFIFNIIAAVK